VHNAHCVPYPTLFMCIECSISLLKKHRLINWSKLKLLHFYSKYINCSSAERGYEGAAPTSLVLWPPPAGCSGSFHSELRSLGNEKANQTSDFCWAESHFIRIIDDQLTEQFCGPQSLKRHSIIRLSYGSN
jgi:hypothetical protein